MDKGLVSGAMLESPVETKRQYKNLQLTEFWQWLKFHELGRKVGSLFFIVVQMFSLLNHDFQSMFGKIVLLLKNQ
jgi:hypothetical protein